MKQIRAGFLPLLDAAILIAAKERGFAAAEGIDLSLKRETSWATVRDRLSVGQFEVVHMLAPLPIAQNLGLMPLKTKMVVPFALGLGGNAITVSIALNNQMKACGLVDMGSPVQSGSALMRVIESRKREMQPVLKFGVVHAFSSHAYELRYWLAASGVRPDNDISIVVVPPSLMADALAAGEIDGFCVGEPWSSVAALRGDGAIVTTKAQIWRSSPEKVLVVRKEWSACERDTLYMILRALHRAAQWCSNPEHFGELAQVLSSANYLAVDAATLLRSLQGDLPTIGTQTDFLLFHSGAANFPWQSHALWFFSQMLRWGDASYSEMAEDAARMTYRPDIYRAALGSMEAVLPGASSKVEGALFFTQAMPALNGSLELGPDGFFDGRVFDPDHVQDYLKALP